ncbi:hypothetical protein TURU_098261 [Turdus rufiventris]|nr:hypothetical protein TURU_098261 [Turdus rufiventris]
MIVMLNRKIVIGTEVTENTEVRMCERTNTADIKASKEGRGEGSPGTREEMYLQLMMKTMVRQAVSLQPSEFHRGSKIHLQTLEEPHMGAGGCLKRGCGFVTLWGAHTGAGSWQDQCPCGERSPCYQASQLDL